MCEHTLTLYLCFVYIHVYISLWWGFVFLSFFLGLSVSVPGLEKSLHQYTLDPAEKPFDMKSVPLATQPITEQKTGILIKLLTQQLVGPGLLCLEPVKLALCQIPKLPHNNMTFSAPFFGAVTSRL